MELTEREQQAYDFIVNYFRDNGFSPSYQEIAEGIYYGSATSVTPIIQKLKDKGYIELPFKATARAIKVVGMKHIMEGFEMTKEEIIDGLYRGDSKAIKEAIEALEQQPSDCKIFGHKENCIGGADCENCDYKMQALEQPTSDDCVSRQAVLDLAVNYGTNSATFLIPVCSVKKLPHVTPTQRWISVSERLPKEDGEYLLFGKIDEDEENYIFIGEYDSCGEQFGIWQEQFDRTTLGCLGSEFFEYSSVIAWQPLPKPYEEKKGNKNND